MSSSLPTMIVGVMGMTGSGKSTFVRSASRNNDVVVGDSLESCTHKVAAYRFVANGFHVILVDTPGFNDTYKSDTEILLDLAKWLEITYRQNAKLTGIVYLHRITDIRMDGGAMRNLKMFRKLCGEQPMKNVIIASTFWGATAEDKAAVAHEAELIGKSDFWGDMIDHGAQVRRFAGTQESALEILMNFASKATVTLDIQRELVDEEKPLGETAAGNAVNEELHRLEKKYKVELEKLQQETAAALAEKDVELERILQKEREKMERKLERIHGDQEMLRQERREEIRRLEAENDRRYSLMKKEYASKMKKQKLEAERMRAEDRSGSRDQMRDLQMQNASLNSSFREQMRQLQEQNEKLASSYETQMQKMKAENDAYHAAAANSQNDATGSNLFNLAAAGAIAFLNPAVRLPVSLGVLVDLINDL